MSCLDLFAFIQFEFCSTSGICRFMALTKFVKFWATRFFLYSPTGSLVCHVLFCFTNFISILYMHNFYCPIFQFTHPYPGISILSLRISTELFILVTLLFLLKTSTWFFIFPITLLKNSFFALSFYFLLFLVYG